MNFLKCYVTIDPIEKRTFLHWQVVDKCNVLKLFNEMVNFAMLCNLFTKKDTVVCIRVGSRSIWKQVV